MIYLEGNVDGQTMRRIFTLVCHFVVAFNGGGLLLTKSGSRLGGRLNYFLGGDNSVSEWFPGKINVAIREGHAVIQ